MGKNLRLYDNPLNYKKEDYEECEYWEGVLNQSSTVSLPKNFKRVVSETVKTSFKLPQEFNIAEKDQIAYSIFNDIIKKLFDTQVIEPITE